MSVAVGVLLCLSLINSAALALIALNQLKETRIKKILRPTTELADFLDDIKAHGYSVVRIDPDSIMARGVRR